MTGPSSVVPSLLALTVNARISMFLMGLELMLDCLDSEAFDRHRRDAWGYAEQAGYLYHDRPIPVQFTGGYELEDAWHSGLSRYEEESSPNRPQIGDEVWLCEEEGFLPGWYTITERGFV